MISLVFIPIFCLYYLFLTNSFNDYRSIQIYLPSNKDEINFIKNNKQIYPRKYSNFDFNNTLFVEEQKLKKLQISVRYLNKSKDLKNGIKINLGQNCAYETFIRILNILSIEKTQIYYPYKNSYFVFNVKSNNQKTEKKTKNFYINCGTSHLILEKELYKRDLELQTQKQESLNEYYKSKRIIYFGYLELVIFNIIILIKRNKIQDQKSYI